MVRNAVQFQIGRTAANTATLERRRLHGIGNLNGGTLR
jgi:hypothetical protein